MSKCKPTRKEIIILILCLLIGFALRFYTFDQKSLWIDEVHTFNDSREGFKGQIRYFKENPVDLLHPPLFYILTNLFYPFEKPERDLRIIPLTFGVLSLPMIYYLSKLFSPQIALPCTFSLAFMTYHISFSQDGRSYSLVMFLGMVSLYLFLRYLKNEKMFYLLLVAIVYAILFYTSYSSIPFIVFSQILWFYRMSESRKRSLLFSASVLNGLTLLLCLPWGVLWGLNYKSQPHEDIQFIQELGSLWRITSGILNDWSPLAPLMVISVGLLILFPIFSENKKNALVLLGTLVFPVVSLYLFCKLFNIQHYFGSRYLINFLPLFFISIYLSLNSMKVTLHKWIRNIDLGLLFLILFIGSNLTILPIYYKAEKQDFRGLVNYLNGHLRDGDKVFVLSIAYIPGMLHYFKIYPESRHYDIPLRWIDPGKTYETIISLVGENKRFALIFSNTSPMDYFSVENRLWIVAGKPALRHIKERFPCALKGYFDGTVCNFRKFPEDASMFLFLCDPKSPNEKGIDMPIE